MALQADAILDLIATTQRDLGENKWTDLSYDLTEHFALPNLLKKNRITFGSGTGMEWNVMIGTSGQARMTGLHDVRNPSRADVIKKAYVQWRHCYTDYVIDDREIAMNRNPRRIVELVKIARHDAMIDLADLLENQFWSKPANSDDTEDLFGVTYWIVSNATQGFNGGNPSGFTGGAGGLSSLVHQRWANYTDRYATTGGVTKGDLIRKWREAATKTLFKPPVKAPEYDTGNSMGYYTNYNVIGPLEEALEAQNENLGNDVASKDGEVLFRKVPVYYVPKLDSFTNDPVFGINWGVFKVAVLSGEWMKEIGPMRNANQPRDAITYTDTTLNLVCKNRRKLFVIDTAG